MGAERILYNAGVLDLPKIRATYAFGVRGALVLPQTAHGGYSTRLPLASDSLAIQYKWMRTCKNANAAMTAPNEIAAGASSLAPISIPPASPVIAAVAAQAPAGKVDHAAVKEPARMFMFLLPALLTEIRPLHRSFSAAESFLQKSAVRRRRAALLEARPLAGGEDCRESSLAAGLVLVWCLLR